MKENIAIAIGIIFFCIAIFIGFRNLQFITSASSSIGIVESLSYSCSNDSCYYYPIIKFTAKNGKEYQFRGSVGSNPARKEVGQKVTILYNPTNPMTAKINDILNIWFPLLGLLLPGIVFFTLGYRSKFPSSSKIPRYLSEHGQPIKATVQQVINENYEINGRRPYVIIAQWISPGNNEAYIFKTKPLWIDPHAFVKPGDSIKVTIDPKNPKKYFVDTSFLPTIKNL